MDLDKDGHGDLLSGGYQGGQLLVFRGLGEGKFAKREALKGADGKDLTTGSASTAHAVDWDGDGDFDLIAGSIDGAVYYFSNEGSDAKPKYAGKVPVQAGGKPLVVRGDSGPVTVDWNGDGTLDLLVGSGDGSVVFCQGAAGDKSPKLAAPVVIIEKSTREERIGIRSKVCVIDGNGDGKLDLLVGTYARKMPLEKELDEASKQQLADLKKQMNEVRATYKKAMSAVYAEVTKNPDWKSGDGMTKEQEEGLKTLCKGDSDLAVHYRESSSKLRSVGSEIRKIKGSPKIIGRVWFFPRK